MPGGEMHGGGNGKDDMRSTSVGGDHVIRWQCASAEECRNEGSGALTRALKDPPNSSLVHALVPWPIAGLRMQQGRQERITRSLYTPKRNTSKKRHNDTIYCFLPAPFTFERPLVFLPAPRCLGGLLRSRSLISCKTRSAGKGRGERWNIPHGGELQRRPQSLRGWMGGSGPRLMKHWLATEQQRANCTHAEGFWRKFWPRRCRA
ncbi:hypothetical protein B0H16DRAFT_1001937 [Mycena metata]|uniref:Uncharacterized protein n=1 Tax=Mycena metata TaxID=1033252 RepID=A0AAD7K143_9AGAR|nr:hypothetical protein B0H16DRAFT_1001937 [Mycena metata]